MLSKKNIFYLSLTLLLYFVFIDELTNTFLLNFSSTILLKSTPEREKKIAYFLLGLQSVASALQTGASDGRRRKSLIFSITITFICLLLFRLSKIYSSFLILSLSVILKGCLGNTLPIAWAGIADITSPRNIRFFLGLSIFALAIGSWGPLAIATDIPDIFFQLTALLVVIAIFFSVYLFRDSYDIMSAKKEKKLQKILSISFWIDDIKELIHFTKDNLRIFCLLSFVFSEISFYQILFRVEMFTNYTCFIHVPLAIGFGYSIGTGLLRFISWKDKYVCLSGSIISLFAIIFMSILFFCGIYSQNLFTTFFALYSLGYALFTPALFSLITPRSHSSLIGKAYGLLESSDSLASLFTFLLIFELNVISCESALIISFISIAISFLAFLHVFRKTNNTIEI